MTNGHNSLFDDETALRVLAPTKHEPSQADSYLDVEGFQKPGEFADYAALVRELANGNIPSVLNMLPWSDLTDSERELAQIRVELAAKSLGAPCNNRLGLIRECGRIIMAADAIIEAVGMVADEFELIPAEVQTAIALAGGDGEQLIPHLTKLKAAKQTEARNHQRWIELAKKRGCYRDYTRVKDRVEAAVRRGERLAPESFIDELDFFTQRLIALCKVSEAGKTRPHIVRVFQRIGTGRDDDDRQRDRRGILRRSRSWEEDED